jgi:hypothetical protein
MPCVTDRLGVMILSIASKNLVRCYVVSILLVIRYPHHE